MIVVKLGGSLYTSSYLSEWVNKLVSVHNETIIIVPGGGPFADQVRKASHDWSVNDEVAHDMAVMAMQQYALVLTSLNESLMPLDSIDLLGNETQAVNQTYVWLPYTDSISKCRYPKNWQVTSDSISLWLAKNVLANKLCLIKSANISDLSDDEIMSSDIVDEYFSIAKKDFNGSIVFYHASESNQFINDISDHG